MRAKQSDQKENDFPKGLSQPALRALAGAGVTRLDQLTKFGEAEINKLHGMGPKGIDILRSTLAAKGLSFADKKSSK